MPPKNNRDKKRNQREAMVLVPEDSPAVFPPLLLVVPLIPSCKRSETDPTGYQRCETRDTRHRIPNVKPQRRLVKAPCLASQQNTRRWWRAEGTEAILPQFEDETRLLSIRATSDFQVAPLERGSDLTQLSHLATANLISSTRIKHRVLDTESEPRVVLRGRLALVSSPCGGPAVSISTMRLAPPCPTVAPLTSLSDPV